MGIFVPPPAGRRTSVGDASEADRLLGRDGLEYYDVCSPLPIFHGRPISWIHTFFSFLLFIYQICIDVGLCWKRGE
jgi:hypothetical protein